jgi:nitrogen regulatory protein PII
MNLKLIISLVKPAATDRIIKAAKAAGATGATIIPGRGTGAQEAKTFFGLTLETQTDVLLFLLEEHLTSTVLEAVYAAGQFQKPGTGIAFVTDVENAVGLESQLAYFEQMAQTRE